MHRKTPSLARTQHDGCPDFRILGPGDIQLDLHEPVNRKQTALRRHRHVLNSIGRQQELFRILSLDSAGRGDFDDLATVSVAIAMALGLARLVADKARANCPDVDRLFRFHPKNTVDGSALVEKVLSQREPDPYVRPQKAVPESAALVIRVLDQNGTLFPFNR